MRERVVESSLEPWGTSDEAAGATRGSGEPNPIALRMLIGLWAVAAILLVTWGAAHQLGAGDLPPSDRRAWQSASGILPRLHPGEPHVLMFIHPQCPCSVASVESLILAIRDCQTAATIVAYRPRDADHDWDDSELIRRTKRDNALQLHWDVGGAVAKQFGVATSGTCILLDGKHDARFIGGITAGRGHEGSNEGMNRFLSQLATVREKQRSAPMTYPVFGCPLLDRH